jgi:hypothetical protein
MIDTLRLLRRITFIGALVGVAGCATSQERHAEALACGNNMFAIGFAARLYAEERDGYLPSDNTLGRNFPTKFEFFQTGRQYEQDGNWFCQGMGRVKSIRPTSKLPFLQ